MVVVVVDVVMVVVFLIAHVLEILVFFDLVYLNFYFVRRVVTSEVFVDVLTSQAELERVF